MADTDTTETLHERVQRLSAQVGDAAVILDDIGSEAVDGTERFKSATMQFAAEALKRANRELGELADELEKEGRS